MSKNYCLTVCLFLGIIGGKLPTLLCYMGEFCPNLESFEMKAWDLESS